MTSMRTLNTRFLALLVGAVALLSTACSSTSTCSRDADAITVPFDPSLLDGNIYHSAPIGGPYTYFPANRTVTFELDDPNATPGKPFYSVEFWLAFNANGSLAPSAGNTSELLSLNDHELSVLNNTCSEFWLWVVAERPGN
jgi:hypothetical protein